VGTYIYAVSQPHGYGGLVGPGVPRLLKEDAVARLETVNRCLCQNHCIKRKETVYLFVIFFLTKQNLSVSYSGTTAVGITQDIKKFEILRG